MESTHVHSGPIVRPVGLNVVPLGTEKIAWAVEGDPVPCRANVISRVTSNAVLPRTLRILEETVCVIFGGVEDDSGSTPDVTVPEPNTFAL